MKITSPEVLFSALLFSHIALNTLSRATQCLLGNDEPILGRDKFELNLKNYIALKIIFSVFHAITIAFGLWTAVNTSGGSGIWYVTLLGISTVITWFIMRIIKYELGKDLKTPKQDRWARISFYTVILIGIAGLYMMAMWKMSPGEDTIASLFTLSVILCAANQASRYIKEIPVKNRIPIKD